MDPFPKSGAFWDSGGRRAPGIRPYSLDYRRSDDPAIQYIHYDYVGKIGSESSIRKKNAGDSKRKIDG
jgi:hypothetical protein